jgi:hypothetical protein
VATLWVGATHTLRGLHTIQQAARQQHTHTSTNGATQCMSQQGMLGAHSRQPCSIPPSLQVVKVSAPPCRLPGAPGPTRLHTPAMATPVQRQGPREGRGRRQGGGGHQHNRWYQAALPPCACLPCPPGALPLQTCAPPNATEKQRQPPPPPLPAQLSWPAVSAAQLQLTHISVVAQQGPRHTPWGHQRDQTPPGLPFPCHSTAACCLQHCSQQGEGAARAPWVPPTARTYTAHSHSHKTSAHTPLTTGHACPPPQTLTRKPAKATSKTHAGEEGSGPLLLARRGLVVPGHTQRRSTPAPA